MLVVCGMQVEAGEEVLSAGEESLRSGRSYSARGLSEPCIEKHARTHGRRQEDIWGILGD